MRLKEFIDYLYKARYTVFDSPDGKDHMVFSRRLYLGRYQVDRGNIVFWFNDNCVLPARDFMLNGLDTSEMRIYYPYRHIFIIKGFKHV